MANCTTDEGFYPTKGSFWRSAVLSGVWGYIIAIVWLAFWAAALLVLACGAAAKRRGRARKTAKGLRPRWCSDTMVALFWFLVLSAALIGIGLAYGGTAKFFQGARATVNLIRSRSLSTAAEAEQVDQALREARDNIPSSLTGTFPQLGNAGPSLAAASAKLQDTSQFLRGSLQRYLDTIYGVLNSFRIVAYVLLSLSILFIIVAVVGGSLEVSLLLGIAGTALLLLCAALWVWAGFGHVQSYAAHRLCESSRAYLQNPLCSSLSDLLPCADLVPIRDQLLGLQEVAPNVTDRVNGLVQTLSRAAPGLQTPPQPLCNPLPTPPPPPTNCSDIETFVPQLEGFYTNAVTRVPAVQALTGLTPTDFNNTANAVVALVGVYEEGLRLTSCTVVTQTVNETVVFLCPDLEWSSSLTWSSLLVTAIALMPLTIMTLYAAWALSNQEPDAGPEAENVKAADNGVPPYFVPSGQAVDNGVPPYFVPSGQAADNGVPPYFVPSGQAVDNRVPPYFVPSGPDEEPRGLGQEGGH